MDLEGQEIDKEMEELTKEQTELVDKINKMDEFIESDEFEKLDNLQKALIRAQYKAMDTYNQILFERIIHL